MLKFIFKRILAAIPTMLVLITVSFFMMRLAPGSPFTGLKNLPPEVMANIEAKYHLNDPMYLQYFHYLKQLAMGDLGPSFKYRDFSVNELLAQALPVSVEIGVYAFSIAVVVGMSLGIYAALRRNTWVDYTLMTVAMIGVIVPSFVKAPILILIFAIYLKWLPAGGWNDGALMNMILPVHPHRPRQGAVHSRHRAAPRPASGHAADRVVPGAGLRGHHHRGHRDRVGVRPAGYWPDVRQWRTEP